MLNRSCAEILGRERRERGSQLAWSGGECFDSRRRVNSDVGLIVLREALWLSTFLIFFASPMLAGMKVLVYIGFLVLGVLAARGTLWAYITFVVLGLLYFPASVGFHLHPQPCEGLVDMALAFYSLGNYAHIVLFVLFFIMTSAQFNMSHWSGFVWAAAACVAMGILVELAEGVSGTHHCRTRDLIPDAAGIMIGAGIVFLWNRIRTKPLTT